MLPRTGAQREYVKSLELPSVVVPERAVDAQTLVALADLVAGDPVLALQPTMSARCFSILLALRT